MRRVVLALAFVCGTSAWGCNGRFPASSSPTILSSLAGIWSGFQKETISEGVAAGDTHIAKQEWHLSQSGRRISGYYVEAETFVSGDGRPYVCNRQPQFSTVTRFDIAGTLDGDGVSAQIQETNAALPANEAPSCAPRQRTLRQYHARVNGDLLVLANDSVREMLYRSFEGGLVEAMVLTSPAPKPAAVRATGPELVRGRGPSAEDADVGGVWVWDHRTASPEGDEKIEREEWHVEQDGADLHGYYDRSVHQISTDGHAYRCSMALDFRLVTRYQFTGQLQDSKIAIFEKSFEVLSPNACDNGKRRLDAYEGAATPDELRLIWERGAQILRRPRPDVPTQRF
jgi:hypothetical protein